ncbi:hypothetical protein BZG36_00436 [Bifiguratus adelaidae]|uniref:Cystathionine beta-synthase n=1 Tax=Bifiguratus adelaidae TaxID=1938954 RepID=A0A261Y7L0_9FUNG|nr:hypothetical protein BZG36_00436 [Bifiguratus adelaidae]
MAPGRENACTYELSAGSPTDPHNHLPSLPEPPILNTILDHIGNTPLVRINKIGKSEGLKLAKCEFFNAGGSVKDRIGKRMVEEAERAGILKPGVSTIIEPTSGNTGIGLALAGAVKGYRVIITLPEKMSHEKVAVLKALGAEIIRTPTEADSASPESHIGVAKRLRDEIPGAVILDQYKNPYNPMAHYDHTAEEILKSCDGKIDMFVGGAGTGGTITGVARKLKEKCPNIKIVGVDPYGSILAQPESLNKEMVQYKVEGIGYDFVPDALDRTCIDHWLKVGDKDAFLMARRLIREEGILCGGSSGTAVWAACQAAKELKEGQRCVVLLPDSVRNYMTKFLDDDWMRENGFTDEQFEAEAPETKDKVQYQGITIKDLSLREAISIDANATCAEATKVMQAHGFDQLPVVTGPKSKLVGLISLGNILSRVSHQRITPENKVQDAMYRFDVNDKTKPFHEITVDTPLDTLTRFFEKHSCAVVTERIEGGHKVRHIVTKVDLLAYVMQHTHVQNH